MGIESVVGKLLLGYGGPAEVGPAEVGWKEAGAKVPGRSGLAAFDFTTGTLLLTEAGSKKRASLFVVRGEDGVAAHDPGGLEVLETGDGFPKKVTAFRPDIAVHGRYGQPCPDCGSPVQRIVYAIRETNYCARCQTGGRVLADRALSTLLKKDWPRSLEALEALRRPTEKGSS